MERLDNGMSITGRVQLVTGFEVSRVGPGVGGDIPERMVNGRGDRLRPSRRRHRHVHEIPVGVGYENCCDSMALGVDTARLRVLYLIADLHLTDGFAGSVGHQNRGFPSKAVTGAPDTSTSLWHHPR
jgi:hypothetical protein